MSELEFFLGPSCLGEGRAEEWASSQGLWLGALFSAQFCLDTTPPPCLGQQEFLPRPFVPPEGWVSATGESSASLSDHFVGEDCLLRGLLHFSVDKHQLFISIVQKY